MVEIKTLTVENFDKKGQEIIPKEITVRSPLIYTLLQKYLKKEK